MISKSIKQTFQDGVWLRHEGKLDCEIVRAKLMALRTHLGVFKHLSDEVAMGDGPLIRSIGFRAGIPSIYNAIDPYADRGGYGVESTQISKGELKAMLLLAHAFNGGFFVKSDGTGSARNAVIHAASLLDGRSLSPETSVRDEHINYVGTPYGFPEDVAYTQVSPGEAKPNLFGDKAKLVHLDELQAAIDTLTKPSLPEKEDMKEPEPYSAPIHAGDLETGIYVKYETYAEHVQAVSMLRAVKEKKGLPGTHNGLNPLNCGEYISVGTVGILGGGDGRISHQEGRENYGVDCRRVTIDQLAEFLNGPDPKPEPHQAETVFEGRDLRKGVYVDVDGEDLQLAYGLMAIVADAAGIRPSSRSIEFSDLREFYNRIAIDNEGDIMASEPASEDEGVHHLLKDAFEVTLDELKAKVAEIIAK